MGTLIETTVDHRAMTALARAARKTLRRKKSRRLHLLMDAVALVSIALALPARMAGRPQWWLDLTLAFLLLALIRLEDAINGLAALYQVRPEDRTVTALFREDQYVCITPSEKVWCFYGQVLAVCETAGYFILLLDERHGQIFDKGGFKTGDPAAFRAFLAYRTGLPVRQIR